MFVPVVVIPVRKEDENEKQHCQSLLQLAAEEFGKPVTLVFGVNSKVESPNVVSPEDFKCRPIELQNKLLSVWECECEWNGDGGMNSFRTALHAAALTKTEGRSATHLLMGDSDVVGVAKDYFRTYETAVEESPETRFFCGGMFQNPRSEQFKDVGQMNPAVNLGSFMDFNARLKLAQVNSRLAYFTEANTLVRIEDQTVPSCTSSLAKEDQELKMYRQTKNMRWNAFEPLLRQGLSESAAMIENPIITGVYQRCKSKDFPNKSKLVDDSLVWVNIEEAKNDIKKCRTSVLWSHLRWSVVESNLTNEEKTKCDYEKIVNDVANDVEHHIEAQLETKDGQSLWHWNYKNFIFLNRASP